MEKGEAAWRTGCIAWYPHEFREACAAVYGPLVADDEVDKPLLIRATTAQMRYFDHFFRKYPQEAMAHHMLRFERMVNFLWEHRQPLQEQELGTALPEGFAAHADLIEVLCSLRYNQVVIPDIEYTFDLDEVVAEANRLREQRRR